MDIFSLLTFQRNDLCQEEQRFVNVFRFVDSAFPAFWGVLSFFEIIGIGHKRIGKQPLHVIFLFPYSIVDCNLFTSSQVHKIQNWLRYLRCPIMVLYAHALDVKSEYSVRSATGMIHGCWGVVSILYGKDY